MCYKIRWQGCSRSHAPEQPNRKNEKTTDGKEEGCEDCLLILRRCQITRPPIEMHVTIIHNTQNIPAGLTIRPRLDRMLKYDRNP